MTTELDGRALDLALAKLTDAPCEAVVGGDVCGENHSNYPYGESGYEPPVFTLDLIAAAEEPLVKAGWLFQVDFTGRQYDAAWFPPLTLDVIEVSAPTEKEARGNATLKALRELMKLKEETTRDAR